MNEDLLLKPGGDPPCETTPEGKTPEDALLMYRAGQNVERRRNLLKHIGLCVLAWLVLALLWEAAVDSRVHPGSQRLDNAIGAIRAAENLLSQERIAIEIPPTLRMVITDGEVTRQEWGEATIMSVETTEQSRQAAEYLQWAGGDVRAVIRDLRYYTPSWWYIAVGAMIAWSGYIAFRLSKIALKFAMKKWRSRATAKTRPDPIIAEYNRLKGLSE